MRALCAALGNPEREFRSLHVVGTNGKTSVTLICAALLSRAGLRTGACVSPHLRRWAERTRIDGEEIGPEAFAAAVAEVAAAVERLEADADGPQITQFEAATAASFVAFRSAAIEVAVVEAGLGGRLDATNVLSSSATALTSVALDHTEWLGETVEQIAAEKIAVLEPGTPLIVGRLEPALETLAEAHAGRLGSPYLRAEEPETTAGPQRLVPRSEGDLGRALQQAPPAPYLRRDAALAAALAATVIPRPTAAELDRVLAQLALPGRAELIAGDPPLIADAAHNEEGALALAEALESTLGDRPRVGCVSVLADKDARSFAAALAPALDHVVCTAAGPGPGLGRPGAEPLEPALLAECFATAGTPAEAVRDPGPALARALDLAIARDGVAVCAGSNYLLRYAWTVKRDRSSCR